MSVVGAALRGFGKALKRKGKVSPTIKSVKPNLKKTVKETKSDEYGRRYQGRGMSPSKSRPKAGPGGMSPDTRSRPKRPKPSPRKPRPKTYPPKRIMTPLAKGGRSFPDLSGDGKVTRKDILMGRGVIKK